MELVETGPNWPRKVRLTLPKGLGPPLKEVSFDRFWAHAGLCHGLTTQGGLIWTKTGPNRPKMPHKVCLTLLFLTLPEG